MYGPKIIRTVYTCMYLYCSLATHVQRLLDDCIRAHVFSGRVAAQQKWASLLNSAEL